jgi:hypothetical protein
MSPHYRDTLDYETGVHIVVEFTVRQREVLDYAVILTVEHQGESAIVRSYDGTHGVNQMHRHSRGSGKAAAPRGSMPVPLAKECEPRSSRFAPTTER